MKACRIDKGVGDALKMIYAGLKGLSSVVDVLKNELIKPKYKRNGISDLYSTNRSL